MVCRRGCCVVLFCLVAIAVAGAGRIPEVKTLPLTFEANRGQAPARYAYVFHRDGLRAWFFRDGVDFDLAAEHGAARPVRLTLVGGDAAPEARGVLNGHSNYFIGNDRSRWIRNVPLSKEVEYSGVYPGISLSFYGNGSELEHDFRVRAGADASQITLRFDGVDAVKLSTAGDLEIHAGRGLLTLRRPVAYQEGQHGRDAVQAKFLLAKDKTVRFALGAYDHARALVIDPVFVFSTYLGGTGNDHSAAIALDASGNIYVAGYTASTDFPVQNPAQPAMGGCNPSVGCDSAFVTKLDPTGMKLIYSTYLGGSQQDYADAIKVDRNGNAIVAGYVNSQDFPHAGAMTAPSSCSGTPCYFLASLSPDGSTLNYSGPVGGRSVVFTPPSGGGPTLPLAVDGDGNAYLASTTSDPQFQVTTGTLSSTPVNYGQAAMFVLKVGPSGGLIESTLVPGTASEPYINAFSPAAIVVDEAGNLTAVGTAGVGLPTTVGVVAPQFPNDPTAASANAGFVLQLNATASAINFASYLPGTDMAGGIAVDKDGNYWIVGTTTETTLPVGQNAYMKAPTAGSYSSVATTGYILELAPQATAALNATYLDGTGVGQIWETSTFTSVALDSQLNVFVGGMTTSADFPLQNPLVSGSGIFLQNLILAEMSPDLTALEFGSLLNSADASLGGSVFGDMAIDGSDNLVVTGATGPGFPTTGGSFEPLWSQSESQPVSVHGFVSKIAMTPAPSLCLSPGITFGSVPVNAAFSQSFTVKNCGNSTLHMYTATVHDPNVTATMNCGAMAPGSVCSGTLTFKPLVSGQLSGWVTFGDDAVSIPQALYYSGYGSGDTSNNPAPMLAGLSPGFTHMGGGGPTLTVTGTGFTESSTVNWGSTALTTQFVGATELTAYVTSTQVASAGTASITVKTPTPGGGTSNTLQMEVDSAGSGVSAPVFAPTTATVAPGGSATYSVTLPSAATSVSAKCLNLPQGATCSYAGGKVTIATSTSTPGGVYAITVVFTETLQAASAAVVLPILLLPLAWSRRRSAKGAALLICVGLALAAGIVLVGCSGGGNTGNSGGGGGGSPAAQTVTSSGTVTLTVQ